MNLSLAINTDSLLKPHRVTPC